MADDTDVDLSPADRLEQLHTELAEHVARLTKRAEVIRARAESEPDPFKREVLTLVSETMQEQVDTGLDFQRELTETVGLALEQGELGEELIGIEPEHAEVLLAPLVAYRGMLDHLIGQNAAESTELLRKQREDCLRAIALIEELTLPAEGEEEGEKAEPN